ncbi:hypothetical protein L7F22_004862 [Adiantum nelumboides]|nr:hypothetical protein [Adiantum nelumboides]
MEGNKVGITKKEVAARAVLRDVWQRGHHCVELRQDGRAFIFFCTLCSTRCYSDASLADHLHGNQHGRRLSNSSVSCSQPFATEEGLFKERDQIANASRGKSKNDSSTVSHLNAMEPFPASSVEWIRSGQLFLEEGLSEQQVRQVWCEWHGRNEPPESYHGHTTKKAEELAHALVVFPYSNAIGRQGEWKPGRLIKGGENGCYKEKVRVSEFRRRAAKNCDAPSLTLQDHHGTSVSSWTPPSGEEEGTGSFTLKDLSQRALLKALQRRRLNVLERLCFICHQQMLPGRDVAALLNQRTGQMMCSSRNERGVCVSVLAR